MPHVGAKNGAKGVQAQRVSGDGMPKVEPNPSGSGVQSQRITSYDATRAPFPWYGGKRRWAASIWSKLGSPGVYAEPFAGSLAVLLHRRQPCAREIVCDTDGLLCNFWRALRADPEAVAYWAAWPTIHQDLTARHTWLRDWRAEHGGEVERDPDFYDVKVAGWWVWGLSNWIGGGWCADDRAFKKRYGSRANQRPHANTAQGVQAYRNEHDSSGASYIGQQRGPHEKRPHVQNHGGSGYGVQAQRGGMPRVPARKTSNWGQGEGVQAQRVGFAGSNETVFTGDILDGSRWAPWFAALAKRLERVVVLNRSWESAVTPSLLQQTPSAPKPPVRYSSTRRI